MEQSCITLRKVFIYPSEGIVTVAQSKTFPIHIFPLCLCKPTPSASEYFTHVFLYLISSVSHFLSYTILSQTLQLLSCQCDQTVSECSFHPFLHSIHHYICTHSHAKFFIIALIPLTVHPVTVHGPLR